MNLDDKELSDLRNAESNDDREATSELDPTQLTTNQSLNQVNLSNVALYSPATPLALQYNAYQIGLNPVTTIGVNDDNEIKRDARGRKRTRPISTVPKRNLSAYMFFANCHRPNVRKIFPDVTTPDITRILGRMWMDASKEEKKVISNYPHRIFYSIIFCYSIM